VLIHTHFFFGGERTGIDKGGFRFMTQAFNVNYTFFTGEFLSVIDGYVDSFSLT
jgi:hypothetical protein